MSRPLSGHSSSDNRSELHGSVSQGSTDVLEHILSHEECDVDPINRIDGATPLHLAVKLKPLNLRNYVVESLLEAGADTTYALISPASMPL